jgi:hypothetical protein
MPYVSYVEGDRGATQITYRYGNQDYLGSPFATPTLDRDGPGNAVGVNQLLFFFDRRLAATIGYTYEEVSTYKASGNDFARHTHQARVGVRFPAGWRTLVDLDYVYRYDDYTKLNSAVNFRKTRLDNGNYMSVAIRRPSSTASTGSSPTSRPSIPRTSSATTTTATSSRWSCGTRSDDASSRLSLCLGGLAWAQSPAGHGGRAAGSRGCAGCRPIGVARARRSRTTSSSASGSHRGRVAGEAAHARRLGAHARAALGADDRPAGREGDGGAAADTSRLGALVGSVRAVVTDRYGSRGSSFEVKTPTAVAGVRGTGFVVLVDADGKRTRVIGLYHTDVGPQRHRLARSSRGTDRSPARSRRSSPAASRRSPASSVATSRSRSPEIRRATGRAGTQPAAGTEATPPEGSGDQGDPATPGPPMGLPSQRPDSAIDQPLDRLPGPKEPPPPPPR